MCYPYESRTEDDVGLGLNKTLMARESTCTVIPSGHLAARTQAGVVSGKIRLGISPVTRDKTRSYHNSIQFSSYLPHAAANQSLAYLSSQLACHRFLTTISIFRDS